MATEATPPDFALALARVTRTTWAHHVSVMLFNELTKHDPRLLDKINAGCASDGAKMSSPRGAEPGFMQAWNAEWTTPGQ